VDPSQFEQVFTNLIGNAIKYRAPERKLSIKVSAERNDDFTTFRVDDNGIGIAQEHLDRVFHAFFRVDAEKVEGDGVGLAIVNRAIDLHNGRAWVESAIGSGSSFFIEIPNRNFIAVKQ
jgi:signal transduction histidine kinase